MRAAPQFLDFGHPLSKCHLLALPRQAT